MRGQAGHKENQQPNTKTMTQLKNTTAEIETAKTILQEGVPFTVAGVSYNVPKPTAATLALVSAQVSKLNLVSKSTEDQSGVVGMVITDGAHMKDICRIIATIVLGAKRIRDYEHPKLKWWERLFKKQPDRTPLETLTEDILYESDSIAISRILGEAFTHMNLGFFFETTTFLASLNLTKTTKETTASGPLSPDL